MEYPAVATAAHPTTNVLATAHEGNSDFEIYIRATLTQIQQQLDDVKQSNTDSKSEILKSLDFNHAQVKELQEKVNSQNNSITALQQQLCHTQGILNNQSNRIRDLESSNTYLESYMRRSNLIFDGCQEREQEDVHTLIVNILRNVLKLEINTDSEIDKVHRYGRSFAGKPRPIIVRFTKHSTRDKVLQAARQLRNFPEKIFINEDLPTVMKIRRAELRSIVMHARSLGTEATQKGDNIHIAGKQYNYQTVDTLPKELTLEAARTRKVSRDTIGFYSRHSPLSNFYSCSFVYNNTSFTSGEQAFQAQKALSTGRDDTARKIMREDDCLTIKKLGDLIKPPQGSTWFLERDKIMKSVLLAKFSQNEVLLGKLQDTGNCNLVEATRDNYWGAGINLSDPTMKNNNWPGQNKLGTLLSEVREQLKPK